MIQLPDDVKSVGYKKISAFQHAQVFHSAMHNFTGTEEEFVKNGIGYKYKQITKYTRMIIK